MGSYRRDFIRIAPLCVASKWSVICSVRGVTLTVTWWTWETLLSLFPDYIATYKKHNSYDGRRGV